MPKKILAFVLVLLMATSFYSVHAISYQDDHCCGDHAKKELQQLGLSHQEWLVLMTSNSENHHDDYFSDVLRSRVFDSMQLEILEVKVVYLDEGGNHPQLGETGDEPATFNARFNDCRHQSRFVLGTGVTHYRLPSGFCQDVMTRLILACNACFRTFHYDVGSRPGCGWNCTA